MDCFYEHTVRLSGMDVDGAGVCKASSLLNHLQNAATLAAQDGGFSREMLLARYSGFWMLVRSWFSLKRPLRWEDEITIRTWHREDKGAMMYRDYDIYVGDTLVGESVSGWVLANARTRKIMRLSDVKELEGTGGGSLCKQKTLSRLKPPSPLLPIGQRQLYNSDTDINGHVNNIRYADFAYDALAMRGYDAGRFLSQLQIGYLSECLSGECLTLQSGALEQGHYVQGVDNSGKPRFDAALIFGQ